MLVRVQGLLSPSQNKEEGLTKKVRERQEGESFQSYGSTGTEMPLWGSQSSASCWGSGDQAEGPEWHEEEGSDVTWEGQ